MVENLTVAPLPRAAVAAHSATTHASLVSGQWARVLALLVLVPAHVPTPALVLVLVLTLALVLLAILAHYR